MVIIDGNCVICAKYKSVLSLGDKHAYLEILNTNLFHEEQSRFNKFSKLFTENPNSICVSCAYKIDLYNTSKSNWSSEKKNRKYCVLCCNEEYEIFKCLSDLKDDICQFTENTITGTVNICLNCSFCLDGWNDIKNFVNQLLNSFSEELNSTTVSSSTSNSSMKKRQHSVASKTPVLRKKGKKSDNVNIDDNSAYEKFKKLKKQEKNDLDEKLQHLVTVDNETIDHNMKLSYSVLTDQKMMFEIPYIACDPISSKNIESTAKISTKKFYNSMDSDSSVKFVSHRKIQQKRASRSNLNNQRRDSDVSVEIVSHKKVQQVRVLRSDPAAKKNDSDSAVESVSHKRVKRTRAYKSDSDEKDNDSDSSVAIVSHKRVKQRRTSEHKFSKLQDNDKDDSDDSSVVIINDRPIRQKKSTFRQVPVPRRPKTKRKFPEKRKVVELEVLCCSKCNEIFKRKYTLILHELEHEGSFSPTIVIEQQDLEKILKNYKDKNTTNSQESKLVNNDAALEEEQLISKCVTLEERQLLNKDVILEENVATKETVRINNKEVIEKEEETTKIKDKDAIEEKETVPLKIQDVIEEKEVTNDKDVTEENFEPNIKKAVEEMKINEKDAVEEKGEVEINDKDAMDEKEVVMTKDNDETDEKEEGMTNDNDATDEKEEVMTNDNDATDEVEIDDKDVVEEVVTKNQEAVKEDVMSENNKEEATIRQENEERAEKEIEEKNEKSTDATKTNEDEEEEEEEDVSDSVAEQEDKTEHSDPEAEKESENEDKETEEYENETENPENPEETDDKKSDTDEDHMEEKTNEDAATEKDDNDEKETDASDEKDNTAKEEEDDRELHGDELDDISSEEGIETNGEVLENGENNGKESDIVIPSGEDSESDLEPLKMSNSSDCSSPDKKMIDEEDLLQKPLILASDFNKKFTNKLPNSDRFKIMEDILHNLGA